MALRDKGFALRAREWDLMAFVEDFGPMRPAELLRLCILTASPATLSTILSRLEKRGLVVRVPDETDARSVIVDVTPEGRQLVNEIWPMLSVKIVAPFNAHFTKEDRATLRELLGRICGSSSDGSNPPRLLTSLLETG